MTRFLVIPKRKMSRKRRFWIFNIRRGMCFFCNKRLHHSEDSWDVIHRLPLATSGDDSDRNLFVAHRQMHQRITREVDIPAIAKFKRFQPIKGRKKSGKIPSRPLAGTKRSGWKKPMVGEAQRR